MVLPLIALVGVGAVATWFTITALSTLAHWVAVAGAFVVFIGLTYNIIQQDWFSFLPFDSELWMSLSAILFSAAAASVSYRLFEAVFATVGAGSALLIVLLVAAGIVLGPMLVVQLLGSGAGALLDALGGE